MMRLLALLLVGPPCLNAFSASTPATSPSLGCDLIMRHVDSFGVGIYAGRSWKAGEVVESALAIPVPTEGYVSTELDSFVEGYNVSWGMSSFGFAMLYNHRPGVKMLGKRMDDGKLAAHDIGFARDGRLGHGPQHVVEYFAKQDIREGQQMWNDYGEHWFGGERGEEMDPCAGTFGESICQMADAREAAELPGRIPGCPHGLVTFRGGRAYARRDIAAGEVVETSRVLRLPLSAVKEMHGRLADFLWYHPSSADDVTVARGRSDSVLHEVPPLLSGAQLPSLHFNVSSDVAVLGSGDDEIETWEVIDVDDVLSIIVEPVPSSFQELPSEAPPFLPQQDESPLANITDEALIAEALRRGMRVMSSKRLAEANEALVGSEDDVADDSLQHRYALLLLGYGALYKSAEEETVDSGEPATTPSLQVAWWEVPIAAAPPPQESETEAAATFLSGDDKKEEPEVTCSNRMYVSFSAVRAISAGDELTVPLDVHFEHVGDGSPRRRAFVSGLGTRCFSDSQ